jgi:hypothetical protein
MSKGMLKLETCAKRGVPVKMPLLNPTKARKKGYLEIRAYDDKVMKKGIEDNDLTI